MTLGIFVCKQAVIDRAGVLHQGDGSWATGYVKLYGNSCLSKAVTYGRTMKNSILVRWDGRFCCVGCQNVETQQTGSVPEDKGYRCRFQ